MAARFVTNRHRKTSSAGDMLQHLNWRSIEDRRKDLRRCFMMYKTTSEKVAIAKKRQT